MTEPASDPPPSSPLPNSGRRVPVAVIWAAMALTTVTVLVTCGIQKYRAETSMLEHMRHDCPGHIAWCDGKRVYILEMANLSREIGGQSFDVDGKPRRVLWSADGKTLYVVVAKGRFDEIDRIDAMDPVSGRRHTILDLETQKLDDNDFDLEEIWVVPWGDAESETDRIVFKIDGGPWYSVEGKRPRVRPEPGRPAHPWDQSVVPDRPYRLKAGKEESSHWLEVSDGDSSIRITGKNVETPGAWFVAAPPR